MTKLSLNKWDNIAHVTYSYIVCYFTQPEIEIGPDLPSIM